MAKLLNIVAGVAMAAATAIAPAAAQSNGMLAGKNEITSISAAQVADMMREFNIVSEIKDTGEPGAAPVLVATTTGGGKFLVGFRQCDNMASASGCRQATISTAQGSAGLAYDDLNRFNGVANVTTVVYAQGNQILIFGRNIFMPGGVGVDNFKLQIALFLQDMGAFTQGRSGAATSVALSTSPGDKMTSKIDQLFSGDSEASAAPTAAAPFQITADGALETEIAIANATGVSF